MSRLSNVILENVVRHSINGTLQCFGCRKWDSLRLGRAGSFYVLSEFFTCLFIVALEPKQYMMALQAKNLLQTLNIFMR